MAICSNCGFESEKEFRFCPECGSKWVETEVSGDPMLGRTLGGKYRILEPIGVGSMGRVYLSEHTTLKKQVAIKVLHRDLQVSNEAIARFQREGIAAGQINHSSVVQIFDFERTDDEVCYLAMEYVDGVDLKQWLEEHGALDPERAVRLFRQILSPLAEAHRHGVVHRDFKPENILVVENATGGLSVKVLDFGLSKLVDSRVDLSQATIPGRLMGTPLYMSPEQWRGEAADPRSDLYAATLIFYQMLAGRLPFEASDITSAMVQTTTHEPPALSECETPHDIAPGLEALVLKGLAKAREDRFQSANEIIAALDAIAAGAEPVAPRRRARSRVRGTRSSAVPSRTPWIVGGGVGVLALVGLAFWMGSEDAGAGGSATLLSSRSEAELSPSEASYVRLLADARDRLRFGDTSSAMSYAERAMDMECADAESLVVRAETFRARDDDDAALADYRDALKRKEDFADAEAGIGWIRFDAGDANAAARHFDAALKMDAVAPAALAGACAARLQNGDATAALEVIDSPAAREVESALVKLWRGRAQFAADRLDAARESFVDAKRLDSRMAAAYDSLGDVYRKQDDTESAIAQYRSALEYAAYPETYRKLAELLIADEKYDDAETLLTRARDAAKAVATNPDVLVLTAILAQRKNDLDAAIQALEAALENGVGERLRTLTLLAQLRAQNGDPRGAIRACTEADEAGDAPASVFVTWGLALMRTEDFFQASEVLERAVEADGENLLARYTLGVLYLEYLGDKDLAEEQFRAYETHGGTDPQVREWLQSIGG